MNDDRRKQTPSLPIAGYWSLFDVIEAARGILQLSEPVDQVPAGDGTSEDDTEAEDLLDNITVECPIRHGPCDFYCRFQVVCSQLATLDLAKTRDSAAAWLEREANWLTDAILHQIRIGS